MDLNFGNTIRMALLPLFIYFLLDKSDSMIDDKIASLNMGIRQAIPYIREAASTRHDADTRIGALSFSEGAEWIVKDPVPVDQFTWEDLSAHGCTDMGDGFTLMAQSLESPPMPPSAHCPRLVLVSDGMPTDDYKTGLERLMATEYGKKSIRMAIGIGEDADYDVLKEFIGNPEIPVLSANNPAQLAEYIRRASTSIARTDVGASLRSEPEVARDNPDLRIGKADPDSALSSNSESIGDIW